MRWSGIELGTSACLLNALTLTHQTLKRFFPVISCANLLSVCPTLNKRLSNMLLFSLPNVVCRIY